MTELIELFKKIQGTSSLNEKKALLATAAENELVRKTLQFLLDSNTVSGISDKKWDKVKLLPKHKK